MYLQPKDLDTALSSLRNGRPKVIAGGTDIFPALTPGSSPTEFVDVTRIRGFKEITSTDDGIRIGPAVTWSQIVSANLPPAYDALKQAAAKVGSIQIQNAGTVAGNLCNASPAADGVPPLLALDAQVELSGLESGKRLLPLSAFVTGVRQTALRPDELVSAIVVPHAPNGMRSAFEKLGSRRYLVISIAMTSAHVLLGPDRNIKEARIAVGSCSGVSQRLPALEEALRGEDPQNFEVNPEHLTPLSPIDDVRGTRAFRLDAVQEQIRRAVAKASKQ